MFGEKQSGATLIEFLVAMIVLVAALATISALFYNAHIGSRQSVERTKAVFLAREGLEAVRSIRADNFDNLTVGIHGLILSEGQWTLAGSYDEVEKFRREINISTVEEGLKKVTADISWEITPVRPGSVSLTEHFADY